MSSFFLSSAFGIRGIFTLSNLKTLTAIFDPTLIALYRKFEQLLKRMDSAYGVRDLEDVLAEAEQNGLVLEKTIVMPANNLSVILRKQRI